MVSRDTAPCESNLQRPEGLDTNFDVSGMIDTDTGVLDRRIFSDQLIYEQEQRRIFARSWLFIAHESQLEKRGDFFQTYMGEDPVIAVRNGSGDIRVMLNSCRHRGARVCRADLGRTKNFTCSYHGWSYDLDGKLVSVPGESYYNEQYRL